MLAATRYSEKRVPEAALAAAVAERQVARIVGSVRLVVVALVVVVDEGEVGVSMRTWASSRVGMVWTSWEGELLGRESVREWLGMGSHIGDI